MTTDAYEPDLGDLVVALLAGNLTRLRDRLRSEGYEEAAELVADLAEIADDYLARERRSASARRA